jgi:soluble lytic murein transglycosylase-like protein
MNKLKVLVIAATVLVAISAFTNSRTEKPVNETELLRDYEPVTQTDPPCLQMYYYIERYADSFNIPRRYAYGIAKAETGYRGPFHWRYNPKQTSCAGAVGPMKVMVSTASWINKEMVSRDRLRTDIAYNVFTSMKLLRRLYNKRGSWKVAFGEYNTGYPCVNGYAERVASHQLDWN